MERRRVLVLQTFSCKAVILTVTKGFSIVLRMRKGNHY